MEQFNTEKTAPERPPIASAGVEKPRSISRKSARTTPTTHSTAAESKTLRETSGPSASRQVRVVEFRSGEAVIRHPGLRDLLDEGWCVKSAVPHLEDSEDVKLLVVLIRGPEM